MNVSVETTSNLGRKLTIAVPSAVVAAKKEEKIKKVASTMKIDGFRKGKVPRHFIQQKYGQQLHNEAISELIGSSLQDALKQENLLPVDVPAVDEIKDIKGQDLQYVAKFEIFPDIELEDFKKIELDKSVADITDEDIDKGIASLQEQFAAWNVVEREAANGDQLIIDFIGSINGVPFKNGDGKNISLELGSQRFIPGFEESLIGVKAGDNKVIDVTFPEEYGAAELAGKPAKFDVTVHSVSSKGLVVVDEIFAKKIGIEDGDVNKIRDKVKSNMEGFLANIVKEELRNQVVEKLIAINKFDIPESLLEKEKNTLLKDDKKNKSMRDLSPEQIEKEAIKRIRLGLLLNKIIDKYNIQPERARIDAKIAELSAMFGGNIDLVKKIYQDSKELLANLKSSVLTEQVMDLVIEYATINNKPSNFYDIANRST